MIQKVRKLSLARETLRRLARNELADVAGGGTAMCPVGTRKSICVVCSPSELNIC